MSALTRCRARRRLSNCHVHRDFRGMTLVEILAVLVILGLVAGTLLISFGGAFGKAKHELAKSGIGVIVTKIEAYRIEHSAPPSLDLGLQALSDGYAKPTDSYYLSSDQVRDPWGNSYYFVAPGPNDHPYEVISYGADGRQGGDDDNADISSVNLGGRGE